MHELATTITTLMTISGQQREKKNCSDRRWIGQSSSDRGLVNWTQPYDKPWDSVMRSAILCPDCLFSRLAWPVTNLFPSETCEQVWDALISGKTIPDPPICHNSSIKCSDLPGVQQRRKEQEMHERKLEADPVIFTGGGRGLAGHNHDNGIRDIHQAAINVLGSIGEALHTNKAQVCLESTCKSLDSTCKRAMSFFVPTRKSPSPAKPSGLLHQKIRPLSGLELIKPSQTKSVEVSTIPFGLLNSSSIACSRVQIKCILVLFRELSRATLWTSFRLMHYSSFPCFSAVFAAGNGQDTPCGTIAAVQEHNHQDPLQQHEILER